MTTAKPWFKRQWVPKKLNALTRIQIGITSSSPRYSLVSVKAASVANNELRKDVVSVFRPIMPAIRGMVKSKAAKSVPYIAIFKISLTAKTTTMDRQAIRNVVY